MAFFVFISKIVYICTFKGSIMRKFLFLLFVLFLYVSAFAQLEVKPGSFKEVHGFVNINDDPNYQTDDNDLPYAVIKVRTENITDKQRRDLRFESNLAVGIMLEYHTGEVWVYLTAKYADYLKISHPDFGVYEYTLPFDLQPKKGYEMALVYKAYAPAAPVKDIYNFLIITADQPNATIYVDDVYVGESGEQGVYKSFRAGEKHKWRIECELYHSESGEATIPVKEGENITVEKRLRPAFGYLNITSSPENGAVVFIDGKKVGQTPFKSDRLASGEHRVRVMKEMFSAAEKTFTVTDGNTTQAPMTMAANFVSVNITTDSNSDIYVDNEKKGTGTWNGRLSDGPHSLEARKASHKTAIKNVQLTLDTTENIVIPDPEPIYGTLEVVSNPIGANIIIDGKNYGTTPRVLGNVLIGTHELRLEKTGCTPVIKNFTLDDKNKLSINEKLPTGKEISISTDKSGDRIYVDGSYIGVSPLTSTLSFGEHEITAIRGYDGDGTNGLNAIKGISGVKATAKTITVAQTGGESSVKLTFSDSKTFTVNGVSFEMIAVKGGTFTMGGNDSEAYDWEKPTHNVTVSDFMIGKFEVTQKLWKAVMGSNPSYFKGDNLPVENVSWNDAQEFIRKLNQQTGQNFRLPTEAEWEYAARGGTNTSLYNGENINIRGNNNSPNLDKLAWYGGNCGQNYTSYAGCDVSNVYDISGWSEKQYNDSKGGTHPVGLKQPNAYGLYDMLGNVWEWCQDWYGDYSSGSQTNPTGPSSGSSRVNRGGSWGSRAEDCRVSNRYDSTPDSRNGDLGFRVVLH